MRNEQVFDSCWEFYKRLGKTAGSARALDPSRSVSGGGSAPKSLPRASDYIADFAVLGVRVLHGFPALIFVRLHVDLEEYEAVRKAMRFSPQAFEVQVETIRRRVGGAFRKAGLWPRKRYFRIHGQSATAKFIAEIQAEASG